MAATFTITDADGKPVDGVVYALPSPNRPAPGEKKAVIDQIDKEFVRDLLVVQVGTAVSFPNHDNIRHHVYSFSKAKSFEIPLYLDNPPAPVVFDKPGAVFLGCNIHDWMAGYVYVVDTSYFAIATGGTATLDLPPGEYEVMVWHPRLSGPAERTAQPLRIVKKDEATLSFVVHLKKAFGPIRAPVVGHGGYR